MSTTTIRRFSVDEYLERERRAETRSEFLGGEIRAMSGGSSPHSLIQVNLTTELRVQLKGGRCRVYNNDMRIKCPTGLYTYPDASVVCGPTQFEDGRIDTLLNPVSIFEVLSPSTQAYDRGVKFAHYRTIPTLREYVLIAQDRPLVEHHVRDESGNWTMFAVTDPGGALRLKAVQAELRLAELYDEVDFAAGFPHNGANGAPES